MVLLVFLIDTGASMNQRTCLGTTFLDIAKGAVESFVKIRTRDVLASRGDRYMLVTFDEPPNCIKAGWRENHNTFIEELKNLTADGLSNLGHALKETFDLLNMHRLQSGIDNYGMGRNPHYLEPAIVITITDGGNLSSLNGVSNELHLPMQNLLPGNELTQEPFRWDQRMFSIILRLPGANVGIADKIPTVVQEEIAINAMSEVTGGKSYIVNTHKSLMQSLESVAQKIQRGVVINFENYGPPPDPILNGDGSKTPILGNGPDCNSPVMINDFEVKKPNVLLPNGIILNHNDSLALNESLFKPIKTEGIVSSDNGPPSIPLRGEDQAVPVLKPEPDRLTGSPAVNTSASASWQSTRRMIYVKANPKSAVGHWPIPESFWSDPSAQSLAPRNAQPIIKFNCTDTEPMVIDNLPFDKYELEPSPLTQFILERKQPTLCWQTYVSGSGRNSELGEPFGYLKASTNLLSVNLFVLPYNYPVLLPLIDDLFKIYKLKPPPKWRHSFELYLASMPMYYAGPLRNALHRMGATGNLIPEHMDGSMSFSVVNYLKKVKAQAKLEAERLVNMVLKWSHKEKTTIKPFVMEPNSIEDRLKDYRQLLLRSNSGSSQSRIDQMKTFGETSETSESTLSHRGLPLFQEVIKVESYKNVFDIPRQGIVDHLSRMRVNFYRVAPSSTNMQNEDLKHSVSIAQMGNYQEHLRVFVPLRDVDPGQARLHAFGNPFRLRRDDVMVDESDVNEAMTGPGSPARKRVGDPFQSGISSKKRKRSETPPPSRRPQGPPNTPPPMMNMQNAFKFNTEKVNSKDVNLKNIMEDLDEVMSPSTSSITPSNQLISTGVVVTPASTDRTNKLDKKPLLKGVNKQLKRLQDLHRTKQAKTGKGDKNELVNGQHNFNSIKEDAVPISNILRTSLETDSDRSEPQQSIQTNVMKIKPVRRIEWTKQSSQTDERKCRLQLQNHINVELRRLVYKEIRSTRNMSTLQDLIYRVDGPLETRLLFAKDTIVEAEKFKLLNIVNRLKTLYTEMQNQM